MAKRTPIQKRKRAGADLTAFSEQLAHQLLDYGHANGLTGREVLMGLVMTERLLMAVLPDSVSSVLEGHATFDAMTRIPAGAQIN